MVYVIPLLQLCTLSRSNVFGLPQPVSKKYSMSSPDFRMKSCMNGEYWPGMLCVSVVSKSSSIAFLPPSLQHPLSQVTLDRNLEVHMMKVAKITYLDDYYKNSISILQGEIVEHILTHTNNSM